MSELKVLGVVGGGTMGAGIAHAGLVAGAQVTLHESDDACAEAARARIERSVRASAERGTLGGLAEDVLARLVVAPDVQGLGSDHDLVIEAVPEDLALKHEVLRAVEGRVGAATLIGTNTSSISIDAIATALQRPGRLLGLHFFNPVPASALVEVVTGAATTSDALAEARRWVEAMGKTAVVVHDSPGFASSRLGIALGLEAIRMVEEGVAAPEDIDAAMALGYKHPVGPLRLTDIVGLDVRLGIAEYLQVQLGERFAPPQLMRNMVAEGRLGKKSGQGFYTW